MQLTDRTILITGGASGLGAGCVRRFVRAGAKVVVADLHREQGEAIAAKMPQRTLFVETDVTDEASASKAVQAALARFGELAGVVHCAGIVAGNRIVGRDGPHDLELFSRVVRVNLIGSFNVLRLAAVGLCTLGVSLCAPTPRSGTAKPMFLAAAYAAFALADYAR